LGNILKTIAINPRLINKFLLAIVLMSALAGVAGSQLAPGVPLLTVLLYSALCVLLIGALVLVAAVVSATVSQWALRNGGTDPQWFWFSGEPLGLKKLRAEVTVDTDKGGV
jgi:cation transporter-like permease